MTVPVFLFPDNKRKTRKNAELGLLCLDVLILHHYLEDDTLSKVTPSQPIARYDASNVIIHVLGNDIGFDVEFPFYLARMVNGK